MRSISAIIWETFLLLRRDAVFLPVATLIVFIFLFANVASNWGFEEYEKILYDIGLAGFHITGIMVAIFWGTKLISDSKREGYLELQLATPVNRSTWVIGKFLGLALTLTFLAVVMLVAWQAMLLYFKIGWMKEKQLIIFGYLLLGWLVTASLAVFLASVGTQATAMFVCLCLWIAGLMTVNVSKSLPENTDEFTKIAIEKAAIFWDLHRFNLSDYAVGSRFVDSVDLWWRLGYGMSYCLLFITFACFLFSSKDIEGR